MKTLQKYNEIITGSKITLDKDAILKGMNGEPQQLKAGTYYINGFWMDICGLSYETISGLNDVSIQAKELSAFNEVE